MKCWSQLIIDVDYSPSDPGINNWFCESTKYYKTDLTAGKKLQYKDPGGLFGGITVKEVDDSKVVLSYGGEDYTLREGQSHRRLDEGGRDYTNFELNTYLVLDFVIENTPAFFRQFQTREQLLKLSDRDIQLFEASDDPCAKFVLGRWHRVLMPKEDSAQLAENYTREAVDAGIADAYNMLSIMYANADTAEDRVDLKESARLRDEAIRLGSEAARKRYARNRIAGILLAPEEPAKVAEEIEQLLKEDDDINPEWYSILGYAYETLGKVKEAGAMYREGIEHGCLRCYYELALWHQQQGNEEEYDKLMEEGKNAGCGFCFTLHADLDEDEYQKKTPELKRHFTRYIKEQLQRGMKLADGTCAFYLAYNYFYGTLGFEQDSREVYRCLERGMAWGDCTCYGFLADILEMGTPSDQDRKDAAVYRLKALRLGDDSAQSKVIIAYRRGLLKEYQDEIEQYWLPEDYDDYEEDDSRWDPYV
jgi:TPR repeat protein